jgi:hypothetical protein
MLEIDGSNFLLTLIIINAIATVMVTCALLYALPRHVKNYLSNAGRWADCCVGLMLIVVILLLPVNVLLGVIHVWLIPLPMAADAAIALLTNAGDSDQMYAAVGDVRMEHEEWATRAGYSVDAARSLEQLLWGTWPLIAIAAVVLFVFGLRRLNRFYIHLARELEAHSLGGQLERMFAEHGDDDDHRHRRGRGHSHRRRRHHCDSAGG